MSQSDRPFLLAPCTGLMVLLCAACPAQTNKSYAVLPAGAEFHPGNSQNTFPFSGVSARYQQIHDAADLRLLHGGRTLVMAAIGFRPSASHAIPARNWEVQLHLGHTTVSSFGISGTFAANVTSAPTNVLPFTKVSVPAGMGQGGSAPNPMLWTIPFRSLFIYRPNQGNLFWEWQSRNGNGSVTSYMDAVLGTGSAGPTAGHNSGTGCTATGRTTPARAEARIATNTTLDLVHGPANAPAVVWLGTRRETRTLGWCTNLYVSPLVALPGMTNAAGTWNAVAVSNTTIATTFYWEAFAQFGFADQGLGGFGLSDLAVFAGPENRGRHVGRVWRVASQNGFENSALGAGQANYGLVTIFEIL